MGLYVAKRITRPVQLLAAAAREIGAGRLDQRVEPQSNDEFGSLVEAFNSMASELATTRRRVERGTIDLERKHIDVARRLAHAIKNPLTPIQLSAERLQRHFSNAAPPAKALVDECTSTIVGEVESLKGLVDEFSQFARMPSPRTVPIDLAQLITDTVSLYRGIFSDVRIEQRFAPGWPSSRLGPEPARPWSITRADTGSDTLGCRGAMLWEPHPHAAET